MIDDKDENIFGLMERSLVFSKATVIVIESRSYHTLARLGLLIGRPVECGIYSPCP